MQSKVIVVGKVRKKFKEISAEFSGCFYSVWVSSLLVEITTSLRNSSCIFIPIQVDDRVAETIKRGTKLLIIGELMPLVNDPTSETKFGILVRSMFRSEDSICGDLLDEDAISKFSSFFNVNKG